MTSPEAISQRDAADRLGISRATVERWVNQGRLNTIRTGERGGARRVLVDDVFWAARPAPKKIPHPAKTIPIKSLTPQNPSPAPTDGIPHADSAAGGASGDRSQATAVNAAPAFRESLTGDAEESLTSIAATESLTDRRVPAKQHAPHRDDSELVVLTSPGTESAPRTEPNPGRRQRGERPSSRLLVVAALLIVLIVGCAVLYDRSQPGRPKASQPASAGVSPRGAHARSVSPPAPHVRRLPARGGLSHRVTATPAPLKPRANQTPSSVLPPSATTKATPPHRVHPITPCQSAGICVPS